MSKYTYNEDFFKTINSEENAYWLGFLYADGCILENHKKPNSKVLEISLASKDKHHLEKFTNSLQATSPIKEKNVNLNGKIYSCNRVTICSTAICDELIKLGCMPRKSLTLKFPTYDIVPKEYIRDFIRGYFDGDGCVFFKRYQNGTNILNSFKLIFIGTEHFLNGILNEFKLIGTDINPLITTKGNAYQLIINGFDNIITIYDYFYNNSNICLERKFNKYHESVEFVKENRISKSGKRGVYLDKRINKWISTITINGVRIRLGCFSDKNDAIIARKNAELVKTQLPT